MNTISQPLVSIVTPVYNTDKYLEECIESVLAQTYENWDYVIVNNCSTDRSFEIATNYASKDNRIRIHNNTQFLPLIQNLNNALRQIAPKSKYCKMVLADDWLFPECIERMVKVAETNPTVGLVGAYRLEEDRVTLDGLPYPSTLVPGRDICRKHLLNDSTILYVFGSATSLLMNSSLVHNRPQFYNENNIHADTEVCFDLLKNRDFGFVHQVLTFTRRHNESQSSFYSKMRTHLLAEFIILKKYGDYYLSETELKDVFQRVEKKYYRFLAKDLLKNKNFDLWTYHRKELNKIGFNFSTLKLCKSALIWIYKKILHV